MVVNSKPLDHNDPCVNPEDDKNEGHGRQNPHDRYGPRPVAAHRHCDSRLGENWGARVS